jgi:hypothetical protein
VVQTSWAFKSADESHCTSISHCGDPLDDIIHACTHRLLFRREILCGVDNEWENFVDIAYGQGSNPLTAQPASMEAGLLCECFFQT